MSGVSPPGGMDIWGNPTKLVTRWRDAPMSAAGHQGNDWQSICLSRSVTRNPRPHVATDVSRVSHPINITSADTPASARPSEIPARETSTKIIGLARFRINYKDVTAAGIFRPSPSSAGRIPKELRCHLPINLKTHCPLTQLRGPRGHQTGELLMKV